MEWCLQGVKILGESLLEFAYNVIILTLVPGLGWFGSCRMNLQSRFYFNSFIQHLKIKQIFHETSRPHFTIVHQLLQMLHLIQKEFQGVNLQCTRCVQFSTQSKRKTKKLRNHFTHRVKPWSSYRHPSPRQAFPCWVQLPSPS